MSVIAGLKYLSLFRRKTQRWCSSIPSFLAFRRLLNNNWVSLAPLTAYIEVSKNEIQRKGKDKKKTISQFQTKIKLANPQERNKAFLQCDGFEKVIYICDLFFFPSSLFNCIFAFFLQKDSGGRISDTASELMAVAASGPRSTNYLHHTFGKIHLFLFLFLADEPALIASGPSVQLQNDIRSLRLIYEWVNTENIYNRENKTFYFVKATTKPPSQLLTNRGKLFATP